MKNRGSFSRGSIARNALAFVAAYLLVLQTALAGLAPQQMQVLPDLAAHVICLNGDAGAPDAGEHQTTPFACCGVGCLVGGQALEGPSAPDQALAYPVPQAFEAPAVLVSRDVGRRSVEGAGPRAPPAIG